MLFTSGSGENPPALTIDSAIRSFDSLGESGPHSPEGWVLSHILNHCVTNEIPFTLAYVAGRGYYLKRGVVAGVMPQPIQMTLEGKS